MSIEKGIEERVEIYGAHFGLKVDFSW